MNIFFSSDFHGFHKNIVKGCTDWKDGEGTQSCRNFNTLEEHNNALLKGINDSVKENDILYFLGDFTFGGIDKIWEFRKQINCKSIHFILGNHDHFIEGNRTLPNHPTNAKAQELFSSVQHVLDKKIGGVSLFLSHFAHRVWAKSHHGKIHLYGHSHHSIPDHGKSMDIGIDVAYWMTGIYRPFSLEEIVKIMETKQAIIVDHHNKNTN